MVYTAKFKQTSQQMVAYKVSKTTLRENILIYLHHTVECMSLFIDRGKARDRERNRKSDTENRNRDLKRKIQKQ